MAEEKPNPETTSAARQLSTEANAFIQRIIDARGVTISSYAQVEWYLAKLILEGKEYDQYKQIDLSFSQDAKTRADKIKAMLKVDGPLSSYRWVRPTPSKRMASTTAGMACNRRGSEGQAKSRQHSRDLR
ncbi:hypothetical protein ACVSQB_06910 [Bradyrhizobium elkanii]